MANYTTVNRVRRILGTRGSDKINKEIVEEAIDEATAIIAGKVGDSIADAIETAQGSGTDEVQREATPKLVRTIATLLAAHFSYLSTFGANAAVGDEDDFSTGYERALKYLDEIAAGTMDIREIAVQILPESNTKGYTPTFGVDDPVFHGLDADRAEAIDDDRTV